MIAIDQGGGGYTPKERNAHFISAAREEYLRQEIHSRFPSARDAEKEGQLRAFN